MPITLSLSVFPTPIVFLIVTLFMVYRIYILSSESKLLVFLTGPLSVFRSITACLLGALSVQTPAILEFSRKYKWLLMLSLTLEVVTDAVLSGISVVLLARKQRKAEFIETTKVMDKLIVYTIESGAATALCSLINIICLLTMSQLGWIGVLVVVPKVYANSLLASLNGRHSLRLNATAYSNAIETTHARVSAMFPASANNIARLTIILNDRP